MPKEKIMGNEPSLEETIAEVKKRNQQMTPEFVDMFIDVIYKMVVDKIERKEKSPPESNPK